jgi:hypothetical protein
MWRISPPKIKKETAADRSFFFFRAKFRGNGGTDMKRGYSFAYIPCVLDRIAKFEGDEKKEKKKREKKSKDFSSHFHFDYEE